MNEQIFTTLSTLERDWLRRKSTLITFPIQPYVLKIIKQMHNTLVGLGGGAGIAAPQIGENKRVMLCSYNRDMDSTDVIINPSYSIAENKKQYYWEGCFSIPLTLAKVARWSKIHVSYFNINGEKIEKTLTSQSAEIFQHEYDHLSGVLITDIALNTQTFKTKEQYDNFLKKTS
jgi:peptide deformylase